MNQNINTAERNRQIILRLKEIKQRRNLTNSQIEDITKAKGTAVSLTSIKRVFAEGSEDKAESFNYNLTLRPLIIALEDLPEEPVIISSANTEQQNQIATLQNILQIKNIEKENLEKEIETLKRQLVKAEADRQRQVDFLTKQIGFKEKQMETKDKQLDERADYLRLKDKEIKAATTEIEDLKADIKGYKKANKLLIVFVCVALFLAAVLPPIVPLL